MKKKKINEINKEIGLKLKLKRNSLGLTQGQLGQHIGLTFQQIQKYEKGTNKISIANLYKLAKVLNTDISYFIHNENNIVTSIDKINNNNQETKEIIKVVGYYNKIQNKKIRKVILQITRSLSKICE